MQAQMPQAQYGGAQMGGSGMVMPQQQQGGVVGGNVAVSVMSPMSAQMGGMQQQGYNGAQMAGMQQGYVQQGGLDASQQQMQQQQGGGYQQVQGGGDNYQQMWMQVEVAIYQLRSCSCEVNGNCIVNAFVCSYF